MWVESTPGAGAVFHFTLPIEPLPTAARGAGRWLTPSWEYLERTHPSLVSSIPPARPEIIVCETGGSLAHLLTRYPQDAKVTSVADGRRRWHRQPTPEDSRYPLRLISPKSPHFTHSQGSNIPALRRRAAPSRP